MKLFRERLLEPIYNNSVLIHDIALRTSWEQWTIETSGERGSGRSVLAAWHDDDDDNIILNKSWRQHPTKQQLYGHLPPITKTIQVRPSRHARYCWRSRDELISDVLLWTPSRGRAKARTYILQLEPTYCSSVRIRGIAVGNDEWLGGVAREG